MILETQGQPFDLDLTLDAGQTFRWQRDKETGWWNGVVRGQLIRIRQTGGNKGPVEFECAPGPDSVVREMLHRYFRLDDNIDAIYESISRDYQMAELVQEYRGLRLMRQEPWECLISYICSANNNVPRISVLVERICEMYGAPIDGQERHAFPTPQRFLQAGPAELKNLKLGLNRGSNIYAAAEAAQNGNLDFGVLRENHAGLKNLSGVGEKIADCVALFSLDKLDAFPVDTNIWQGLRELYPDESTIQEIVSRISKRKYERLSERETVKLREWAQNRFGPYAGYAGQFIFRHYRPQTKGSGYSGRRRQDRKLRGGGR